MTMIYASLAHEGVYIVEIRGVILFLLVAVVEIRGVILCIIVVMKIINKLLNSSKLAGHTRFLFFSQFYCSYSPKCSQNADEMKLYTYKHTT